MVKPNNVDYYICFKCGRAFLVDYRPECCTDPSMVRKMITEDDKEDLQEKINKKADKI